MTFHLKKTTAESYQLLIEAHGEYVLTQESGDFDVKDMDHPGQSNNLKMQICKHYWMKTQLKR